MTSKPTLKNYTKRSQSAFNNEYTPIQSRKCFMPPNNISKVFYKNTSFYTDPPKKMVPRDNHWY